MTGKVTFTMVREQVLCVEWQQEGVRETKSSYIGREKIARISFPLLKEPVDVVYREFSWYSSYGFLDKVRVEVQEPIRFAIFEQGLGAHERSEKRLCAEVVRLVRDEQACPKKYCTLL